MAIKINNITPEMSVWGMRGSTRSVDYIYKNNITLNEQGGIEENLVLNFGRKGDRNVCVIDFEFGSLLNLNPDEYNTYCVFKKDNGEKITCNIEGGQLVVPEEITRYEGNYEMIVVFQEQEYVTSDGNTNAREYFVSNVFKGRVQSSDYDVIDSATIGTDEYIKDNFGSSLIKNNIGITINTPNTSTSGTVLGNRGDRHVKKFIINGNNFGQLDVYFFDEGKNNVIKYENIGSGFWIPKELTEIKETNSRWKMLLVATNGEQQLVFNTLTFTVNENWLTIDDLYTDITDGYVVLKDNSGDLLIDINGVMLTAMEVK